MLHRACTSDLDARQHLVFLNENMDRGLCCVVEALPTVLASAVAPRAEEVSVRKCGHGSNHRNLFSTLHCGSEGHSQSIPSASNTCGVRLDLAWFDCCSLTLPMYGNLIPARIIAWCSISSSGLVSSPSKYLYQKQGGA